jgi:hypothetical protein
MVFPFKVDRQILAADTFGKEKLQPIMRGISFTSGPGRR